MVPTCRQSRATSPVSSASSRRAADERVLAVGASRGDLDRGADGVPVDA